MTYFARITPSEEAIKLKYRKIGALGVIVRYSRAFLIRKKIKNMLYWRHHELVLKIQSLYRKYITRKNYIRMVRKIRFKDRSVGKAAATIQKVIRSRYLLTHSLTYSLTYLLTHSYSLTYSLTHSFTHSLTHSFTYSLTHSLTHSLI